MESTTTRPQNSTHLLRIILSSSILDRRYRLYGQISPYKVMGFEMNNVSVIWKYMEGTDQ